MPSEENSVSNTPSTKLPFPVEWLKTEPGKVEALINKMSVADQARCVLQLHGVQQQDLILLSKEAMTVVRLLPDEELYQTVKEIGQDDALPLIALCSQKQLQFMFDMEWWQADRFSPQRAIEWIALVSDANDQQLLHWFYTEDFDQKVMALQALIKVYKRDEMTDQYENVEDLPHYTPDGVYDIFFKDAEAQKPFSRIFKMLYSENQKLFYSLMEGVIWYATMPTVEMAYRWYLSRNEERGLLPFEEAFQVYSLLDAQTLKESLPSADNFRTEDIRHTLAPAFPLEDLDPGTFFGQCLAIVKSAERFHAISWELAWMFHKVMVADRRDFADIQQRHDTMHKVLGYINIGLELGAGGDIAKGETLLTRTYMQSLFQVGYAALMRLKWEGEKLLKENGRLVEHVLPSGLVDHFAAAVDRFPKIGVLFEQGDEAAESNVDWVNPRALEDLGLMEEFLIKTRFYVRLAKQGFGLDAQRVEALQDQSTHPSMLEDFNILLLTTTMLAQHTLFGHLACDPLPDVAAKTFLQTIFVHNIHPDDPYTVDEDKVAAFEKALLGTSLAWSEEDRAHLQQLMKDVTANLEHHFGRLNLQGHIDWKFTRGLLIQ
ncbi:DUF6178 family protein [Nitrospina watsonii]|uniref:Uncharacterized protein n=1 Tax=Nitrospina watsonii TaxID=1323948 RepID=A0ABN8VYZ2_9BACT|nr:DUF6178 family protein [Nitrospina watsonii]CAI2717338.1 conserved protein of unknown function [Nitrospina watsonii]